MKSTIEKLNTLIALVQKGDVKDESLIDINRFLDALLNENSQPTKDDENIESAILSLWLNSYLENDWDDFKIVDLSKRFNVSIKFIIDVVKDELKTDYLKMLSTKELKGMYSTFKIHEESLGNKIQMAIIKSILGDRSC